MLFSVFHLILLLSQFTQKSLSLLIYGYLSTISQCWSLLWHLSSSYLFFRPVLNEIYEKLLIHLIVHRTSSINSSLLHRVREFAPLLSWMSLTFYRTIADKLRTRPWQVITEHWHSLALALLLLHVFMVKSSKLCDACVRKLYLELLQIHRLLVETEPHETSSSKMWNDHHFFVISYMMERIYSVAALWLSWMIYLMLSIVTSAANSHERRAGIRRQYMTESNWHQHQIFISFIVDDSIDSRPKTNSTLVDRWIFRLADVILALWRGSTSGPKRSNEKKSCVRAREQKNL